MRERAAGCVWEKGRVSKGKGKVCEGELGVQGRAGCVRATASEGDGWVCCAGEGGGRGM